MRRYRWLIITVAVIIGAAALAIAVGAIWLNSYIHSPGFKEEVESRASQSVGGPVQFETIDFDVLHGVKLRGLVAQIDSSHGGGQGALKASITQVNCTYSFWDLLARKLRLTGIILDQPQVTLTREPTAASQTAPANAEGGGTPATEGTAPGAAGSGNGAPFQFVLDRMKINKGSLTVIDASGATMANLEGVNASADTSGYSEGRDVTGTVSVEQIAASNIQVKNFSTSFTCHSNFLSAKQFNAKAFDGRLAGDFLMNGPEPSTLTLNANGINVEQAMAAVGTGSSAHLTGSLDFQSKWRSVETNPLGEGDAQFTNGKIENSKILQQISSILRIKELNAPVISKATTHFVVRNRNLSFNGLQLSADLFNMTGNGTVYADGRLGADLVLILTRDTMGRLPKEFAQSFVQQPDGTGSIQFHLSGTTSDPNTDLPQKLVIQNLKQGGLNKVLNKFFH